MKHLVCNILILIFIAMLAVFYTGCALTKPSTSENDFWRLVSPEEYALYKSKYLVLQIAAIENDLCFHYMLNDEGRERQEPHDQLMRIQRILNEINKVNYPSSLKPLQIQVLSVAESLRFAATGVGEKTMDQVGEDFNLYWEAIRAFIKEWSELEDAIIYSVEYPDAQDPVQGGDWVFNEDDIEALEQADQMALQEQYQEAVALLIPLVDAYEGTRAEGEILDRIMTYYFDSRRYGYEGERVQDEQIFAPLDRYIRAGTYSKYMWTLFLQWRTIKQISVHGRSNYSNIPNDRYFEVMWRLVGESWRYSIQYPDEAGPKVQVSLLMTYRPIERFPPGFLMGNSAVIDMGTLTGYWEDAERHRAEYDESEGGHDQAD